MVRIQLDLDDALHRRLRKIAQRQGRTVSDLVREALTRSFGAPAVAERLATLDRIAGLWRDRNDLGGTPEYVGRLRSDPRRSRPRGS